MENERELKFWEKLEELLDSKLTPKKEVGEPVEVVVPEPPAEPEPPVDNEKKEGFLSWLW